MVWIYAETTYHLRGLVAARWLKVRGDYTVHLRFLDGTEDAIIFRDEGAWQAARIQIEQILIRG